MSRESAGLLLHRSNAGGLEVFLVHPGGPYWARKDHGAWSIPKGEIESGEDPLTAARREFREETGIELPAVEFTALAPVKQSPAKTVWAWAARADCDPEGLVSTVCSVEWPPRSGCRIEVPEVDRAAWFPIDEARRRILAGQRPLLDQLERSLEAERAG